MISQPTSPYPVASRPGWEPPARPAGRRRGIVALALVFAVLLGAGAVGAGVGISRSQTSYPSHWDPRIAPIASEVEGLRGLKYKHAVPVRFLSEREFKKLVAVDSSSIDAAGKREIERLTGVLRAVGLLKGDVDLRKAFDTASQGGTLAFYSPADEEIVVRGTKLDVSHRVTLAHELTHVLQDQHFDLEKIGERAAESEAGSADALDGLEEGDAVRIEDEYVAKLSKSDQDAYDAEQVSLRSQAEDDLATVPEVLQLLIGAPYAYGPVTVRVLDAVGGNDAVNRAFTSAAPSTRIYIEPGSLENQPVHAAEPTLGKGEKKDGEVESFGPFELYLTLATRLAPVAALDAADATLAGRAVAFKRGSDLCYRVAVVPKPGHAKIVRSSLSEWAKTATKGVIGGNSTSITMTACDPGKQAPGPDEAKLTEAGTILAVRDELVAEFAEEDNSVALSQCIGRVSVQNDALRQLFLDNADATEFTDEQYQQLGQGFALARSVCETDTSTGLR